MLFIVIAFGLVVSYAAGGKTEIENSIETKEEACYGGDYSTLKMSECMSGSFEEWDKELNKNYQLIMSQLDDKGKKKLKDSQRKWIAYRDAELDFVSYYHDDFKQEGTMRPISYISAKIDITKKRALELLKYNKTY